MTIDDSTAGTHVTQACRCIDQQGKQLLMNTQYSLIVPTVINNIVIIWAGHKKEEEEEGEEEREGKDDTDEDEDEDEEREDNQ